MRIDWRFALAALVVVGGVWIAMLLPEAPRSAWGERALFADGAGAQAFGSGATVAWRDARGVQLMEFVPTGAGAYFGASPEGGLGGQLTFIPIGATPEEDYVVQSYIPNEDVGSFGYSFVLRRDDEYRSAGMLPLDETPPAARALCDRRNPRWCELRSGADLIRYYRAAIYPELTQP